MKKRPKYLKVKNPKIGTWVVAVKSNGYYYQGLVTKHQGFDQIQITFTDDPKVKKALGELKPNQGVYIKLIILQASEYEFVEITDWKSEAVTYQSVVGNSELKKE